MTFTLAQAQALDAKDPLAAQLPENVIYLDGNSLGARPKASMA